MKEKILKKNEARLKAYLLKAQGANPLVSIENADLQHDNRNKKIKGSKSGSKTK